MKRPTDSQPARPWVRLLLAVLALLLLHAQGLGQWHRVAHASPASAESADPAAPHPFGHPAGDEPGCRLFDHLGSIDGLLAAPPALGPAVPPPAVAWLALADRPGRVLRPYQARAPPRA